MSAEARRQEELAAARAQFAHLPWQSRDRIWIEATDERRVPFGELSDKRIWDIVTWLVRTARESFKACADAAPSTLAFGPYVWLAGQPLFITLVVEVARRGLSLPTDVFDMIEHYLNKDTIKQAVDASPKPWRDPELRRTQGAALDRIAGLHDDSYAQEHRNIDLG